MTDFDFIVVGGGSAGCAMAERLSKDRRYSVLLVEEGGEGASWLVSMSKGFGRLVSDSRYASHTVTAHDWGAENVPADTWIRGKMLGGSSCLNGMVWIRGQPEDYDSWEALGLTGWNWTTLLPYFKRLENHGLGTDELRGVGGPIEVNTHSKPSRVADAFINTGAKFGLEIKHDQNGLDQEGIGYLQVNVDRRGRRCSAARGFLEPARGRPNLHVATGTRIDRVLFEHVRVIGVEGVRTACRKVQFHAAREVILCAGGIFSPRILQLSGIGPANVLRSAGVALVRDLPGVGRNLREHWLLQIQFRARSWRDSANLQYSGWRLALNAVRYKLFGNGPLATAPFEVGAFVRTEGGLNRPNAQIMFMPLSQDRKSPNGFEKRPGLQIFGYLLRPSSSGSVAITSADPTAPLEIHPNYLTTSQDRAEAISMVKYIREMARTEPFSSYILNELDETSWARDDDQILELFRRWGQAGYHACGTCAMGVGDEAVVDGRLKVHGVANLRIADLSVFPDMISGNTNAPVMALAWRAADLILEDHADALHPAVAMAAAY